MTTDWAIDLTDVTKTYNRKIRALVNVAMQVGRGEIFGLLGPNGAGKSTLVKIMMTVVRPNSGHGAILGQPLGHTPTLQRIGYLPEGHRLPPYLTAAEALDFYAVLSELPVHARTERIPAWLDRMGMTKWADVRIGQFSKGMMQRIGLIQSLIHDPDLIVLDEPTDGIDPLGRKLIREILMDLRHRGKTIFINSHILSELEMVCDRVAILIRGQVARQGTVEELTAHNVHYEIVTTTDVSSLQNDLSPLNASALGATVSLRGENLESVNRVIDFLRSRAIAIESVRPLRWSLEDVFVDAAKNLSKTGNNA